MLALKREREGDELFQELADELEKPEQLEKLGQLNDVWPVVAATHLWRLRLHQNRLVEAENFLPRLRPHRQFRALAPTMPEDVLEGPLRPKK